MALAPHPRRSYYPGRRTSRAHHRSARQCTQQVWPPHSSPTAPWRMQIAACVPWVAESHGRCSGGSGRPCASSDV
eukprot:3940976-Prymnesium_polylepis.1